jgi:hypothetical protein
MLHEKCVHNFDRTTGREKQLGRSRRRWEDNIKVYLVERHWIDLDEDE